jgi:hypothetical protein
VRNQALVGESGTTSLDTFVRNSTNVGDTLPECYAGAEREDGGDDHEPLSGLKVRCLDVQTPEIYETRDYLGCKYMHIGLFIPFQGEK